MVWRPQRELSGPPATATSKLACCACLPRLPPLWYLPHYARLPHAALSPEVDGSPAILHSISATGKIRPALKCCDANPPTNPFTPMCWCSPALRRQGKNGSIFDKLEDLNADACLDKAADIVKSL